MNNDFVSNFQKHFFLQYMNPYSLFNAKSYLGIYISNIKYDL